MTTTSWDAGETKASEIRWKGRNHLNFEVGRCRLRALPVVIHILPEDIDWFSSDSSLFDELKLLLRDRVISATGNGDKDPEATKSRKRARKEELCVQGERLQFTYRYRKTLPRYTVLSYADDSTQNPKNSSSSIGTSDSRTSAGSGKSNHPGSNSGSGSCGPEFRHLPLSESTLLVWVYRFDRDDPYRPVPNEAALHFAQLPPTKQVLDVEAVGRRFGDGAGATVGVQGGPRDTGLLAWLWAGDTWSGGSGSGTGGAGHGGGVRQHFIGGTLWQGKTASRRAREEEDDDDDDIQRAIALSLATASGSTKGFASKA